MKSRKFLIVAGVEAGYGHDNAGVASVKIANKVAALWQQLAAEEFKESDIYIAAVGLTDCRGISCRLGMPSWRRSCCGVGGCCKPAIHKRFR